MALMKNVAIHFLEDLYSYDDRGNRFITGSGSSVRWAGFVGSSKRRQPCLKMKASVKGNVDSINGRKVNGALVDEKPLLEQRNHTTKKGDLLGRFVEDCFVYRQLFVVRSYEIGPDKTATMETLMNLLQVI